jgi:opacity protein-like surface antigen
MHTFCAVSVRYILVLGVLLIPALLDPPHASAQFGIGGRFAWVKADSDADEESVRFTGGQIRLMSPRWGLEVSMDRHSESFDVLDEKVTQRPIQASLLLRLGGHAVSPFLLAGPGWYKTKVEAIDGSDDDAPAIEETEFGWHAGGGLEIRLGRHLGLHGDYRYTFLDFGDDEDEDEGFFGRLLPGHRGSMWTLGATIYF